MPESNSQWQVDCKTIVEKIVHILDSKLWTDCTMKVGPFRRIFKAHKLILAASSPVFANMFYGGTTKIRQPIELDEDPDVFRALLRYMYSENVNIHTVEAAYNIYYAAERYIVPHLMAECISYIASNLTVSNVIKAFEFARLNQELDLADKCLLMICADTWYVLHSSGFYNANIETVVEIFGLSHINISSEVDLFNAAISYQRHKTFNIKFSENIKKILDRISTNVDKEVDKFDINHNKILKKPCTNQLKNKLSPVSLRSPKFTMQDALQRIRFMTITPQEFATLPVRDLLSADDAFGIIMNIISPEESKTSMPMGFSTSTEIRTYKKPIDLSGIKHCYIKIENDEEKLDATIQICKKFYNIVVFCDTVDKIQKMKEKFQEICNQETHCIHEDMGKSEIDEMISKFNNYDTRIVSTSLASSVDMKDVFCSINYDLPSYKGDYSETRALKYCGFTVSLVTHQQMKNLRDIEKYYSTKMKEIPMDPEIGNKVSIYYKGY